jgi:hypothetical protein
MILRKRGLELQNRVRFWQLVTGNEAVIFLLKPKRKYSNQFCATKNAKHQRAAKRICTVKQILYFVDGKGPVEQTPVSVNNY